MNHGYLPIRLFGFTQVKFFSLGMTEGISNFEQGIMNDEVKRRRAFFHLQGVICDFRFAIADLRFTIAQLVGVSYIRDIAANTRT